MKIVDLTPEHEDLYFKCLEEWSEEMKEAGSHKACWYNKFKNQGLGVKLSLDDAGTIGGMIQYIPIEHSPAQGSDMYFIPCIWVHGHKKGRGSFQKKGMGKALLQAAEEDIRDRGAKALVAWGLALPFWMRASWYKKQGYEKVDSNKGAVLLWKKFADDAVPPAWIRPKKTPGSATDRVIVRGFVNGWCPVQNITVERARRAVEEIGPPAEFALIDTSDRETFLEWGIMDSLYINDKMMRTGPPPSYKKIKKAISKAVKRVS